MCTCGLMYDLEQEELEGPPPSVCVCRGVSSPYMVPSNPSYTIHCTQCTTLQLHCAALHCNIVNYTTLHCNTIPLKVYNTIRCVLPMVHRVDHTHASAMVPAAVYTCHLPTFHCIYCIYYSALKVGISRFKLSLLFETFPEKYKKKLVTHF